jgi:hypothetical protein
MSGVHVNDQHRRSSPSEHTNPVPPGGRFADEDPAWAALYTAVRRGHPAASEEAVKALDADPRTTKQDRLALSGAIAEFNDVCLSIVGADVYLPLAPDPAARFSSHSAAFEASCRFHDRAWQPIGCSWMTREDTVHLEILRRCAFDHSRRGEIRRAAE